MKPTDWNHEKDTQRADIRYTGDNLHRRVYFNNESCNVKLTDSTSFHIGVLLQQILMFEDPDCRIDDEAILYRELNPVTDEFVYITFGDIKEAIINMKRIKGLNGLCKKSK